jgi:hypothetical protein
VPLPFSFAVSGLLESVAWYRQSKLPSDAILRALLAECELNVALLNLVKLDSTEPDHQDPGYLDVALQLRGDVLRLVLGVDDLAEKSYSTLCRIRFVLPADEDEPIIPDAVVEPASVSERIGRVAVALTSVRAAAELLRADQARPQKSTALRRIRMRQRLSNLSVAYDQIARALRAELPS